MNPKNPVGPDLGGGDAAPVAVEPLAHVHVEVHAARQVRLVLQQPHLRSGENTSNTLRTPKTRRAGSRRRGCCASGGRAPRARPRGSPCRTPGSASCCSSRTCAHRGWKPHKPSEPQKPVGPDLGGGDVAPVAVEPLAHVHVEVHAARQVRLVLQQPHLRPRKGKLTNNPKTLKAWKCALLCVGSVLGLFH